MIKYIILSGLRVHANISREIYYSIDSLYKNNKSHSGPVQYVLGIITANPPVVWAKITLPTRGLKSVT